MGRKYGPISPAHSAAISAANARRRGLPRAKASPESRAKRKAAWNGRIINPWSPESRAKASKSHKGKTLTPEHRINIGNAQKGISKPTSIRGGFTIKSRCPHCGLEAHLGNLHRYHLDKCKDYVSSTDIIVKN